MSRRISCFGTTAPRCAHAIAGRKRGLDFQARFPRHIRHPITNASMKHNSLAITFLAVAAFSVGCKPSEEKTGTDNREATAQQFDKARKETKEAAQEMKDYAYAQKAEFVEKMQTQLAEINKDLDGLSAKIEKASDAAKAEAKPRLEGLRAQTARLTKQLEEAKGATESTWDSVKTGFKKGYAELKDGFQQARHWVSEKIAP